MLFAGPEPTPEERVPPPDVGVVEEDLAILKVWFVPEDLKTSWVLTHLDHAVRWAGNCCERKDFL